MIFHRSQRSSGEETAASPMSKKNRLLATRGGWCRPAAVGDPQAPFPVVVARMKRAAAPPAGVAVVAVATEVAGMQRAAPGVLAVATEVARMQRATPAVLVVAAEIAGRQGPPAPNRRVVVVLRGRRCHRARWLRWKRR